MRESEEERFAAFVHAQSAALFRTAYLMSGDYQRAEDLLQTTLVRVYQRWPRIDAMDRPGAYARRILVNQAVSWWRLRSSREALLMPGDEPSWDGQADEVVEHERVWKAVLTLPPRQRAVMVLRYYEDLSEADIATTLNMAPGTVKSHSHAASRRLAHLLAEPLEHSSLPAEEATP